MAVHPTRFLNRNSPLDMFTVDQLYAVPGKIPPPKKIPPRQFGPPRPRAEVQGEQDADRLYQQQASGRARPDIRTIQVDVRAISSPGRQVAPAHPNMPDPPQRSFTPPPTTKPKARLKPMLVSPDPDYQGAWTPQPCRQIMTIEIEVEDLGIIEYPVECEELGAHVNSPHMARIKGINAATSRPYANVFVGWYDA